MCRKLPEQAEACAGPTEVPSGPSAPTPDERREYVSLLEFQAQARAVLEALHSGVVTINTAGMIEALNPAAGRIFGYEAVELIGRNVNVLMPEPYRGAHNDYIDRYLKTGRPRVIGTGREVVGRRKDGSTFPIDLTVSEVVFSRRRLFIGIVRDISNRRRLEKEVLQVSINERRRIGQDLHDGLQQSLAAIAFALKRVENGLRRDPPRDNGESADALCDVQRMIATAMNQTRQIVRGLFPGRLEEDGLNAALEDLAQSLSRLFEVSCTYSFSPGAQVDDFVAGVHLYRIAQEAANNAIRHGKARRVRLSLTRRDAALRLEVADDGVGFIPHSLGDRGESGGLGLQTMEHRARLMGCTFDIQSRQGGGTVVSVQLPAAPSPVT